MIILIYSQILQPIVKLLDLSNICWRLFQILWPILRFDSLFADSLTYCEII